MTAMAAARRQQRRRRLLNKGCGVCVLCFADLTLSYEASKNLETFQETSSRLPGTPLPAVTGLVRNITIDALF